MKNLKLAYRKGLKYMKMWNSHHEGFQHLSPNHKNWNLYHEHLTLASWMAWIYLCESCHNMMQKLTIAFVNQGVVHPDINPKIHKFILKETFHQAKTIKLTHKWAFDQTFVKLYCHLIGALLCWHMNVGDQNILTMIWVWFEVDKSIGENVVSLL
jgi:hypothetical protein